jgi:hypothetical protein
MVNVPHGEEDVSALRIRPKETRNAVFRCLEPDHATRPSSMGQSRTGHLTAPHLLHCVTTGSPKRAALHSPAWRRSHHSSQRPGVMPGTAAATRTVVAETNRATGSGKPASRAKGGAFAEFGNLQDDIGDR